MSEEIVESKKFDSNGTFLLKFGSAGKGDGQFSEIEHMATDSLMSCIHGSIAMRP